MRIKMKFALILLLCLLFFNSCTYLSLPTLQQIGYAKIPFNFSISSTRYFNNLLHVYDMESENIYLFEEDSYKKNNREFLNLVLKGSYFQKALPDTIPGRFTIDEKGNLYILEYTHETKSIPHTETKSNNISELSKDYKIKYLINYDDCRQQIKIFNNGNFIKNITLDNFNTNIITGLTYIDGFIILVTSEEDKIYFFDPQNENLQFYSYDISDGINCLSVSNNYIMILTRNGILKKYEFLADERKINFINENMLFSQYFDKNVIDYVIGYSYDENLIIIYERYNKIKADNQYYLFLNKKKIEKFNIEFDYAIKFSYKGQEKILLMKKQNNSIDNIEQYELFCFK